MQEILVILFVAAAAVFLVRFCVREYFVKKDKCTGCAVHKMLKEKGK